MNMKLNLLVLAIFMIGLCSSRAKTDFVSSSPSSRLRWGDSSTITPYPMTCICDCCESVGCTPTRQGVIHYVSPNYCTWVDCRKQCSDVYRVCYSGHKNNAHCSGNGAIHFKINLSLFLGLLFLRCICSIL